MSRSCDAPNEFYLDDLVKDVMSSIGLKNFTDTQVMMKLHCQLYGYHVSYRLKDGQVMLYIVKEVFV